MNFDITLERLKQLCSRSEKSPGDILNKLKKWDCESDYERIISILKKENYINEFRYTNSFINDKIKFSKWGKIKIRYALSVKGISENIIESGLKEYDNNNYYSMVKYEIEKKAKTINEKDKFKRKQKISNFAFSRGYEPDIFQSIIEKVLK